MTDGGTARSEDAGPPDSTRLDDSGTEGCVGPSCRDAEPLDSEVHDADALDSQMLDAGPLDSDVPDADAPDSDVPDADVLDSDVPDAVSCVVCAPAPTGCAYDGGTCETCGLLRCGCLEPCGPEQYCALSVGCGVARPRDWERHGIFSRGECIARPSFPCPIADDPVCGCDGSTYGNACLAFAAGSDVRYRGACAPAECAPMAAWGVGECRTRLGWKWDGAQCEPVDGCSCRGDDCDRLGADTAWCGRWYHCEPNFRCVSTFTCDGSDYCYRPDATEGTACGVMDWAGICLPKTPCPPVDDPVCGCDGLTYPNACVALMEGPTYVAAAPADACVPDDCRSTGCPEGFACDWCLGTAGPEWNCMEIGGPVC